MRTRFVQAWLVLIVLCSTWLLPAAGAVPRRVDQLRLQAEELERLGQWDRACEAYERLLVQDHSAETRHHYRVCLHHLSQVRRYRDASFRHTVQTLPVERALDVYEEIVTKLTTNYVDRDKVELPRMLREGAEELRWALADETFRQEQLLGFRPEILPAFLEQLRLLTSVMVRTPAEARVQVREVARTAARLLGLRPTVVVLEFACAACNTLDEYSVYLTPDQLTALNAALDAHYVGVGIEVESREGGLIVVGVLPGSAAALAGLKIDDLILTISRKSAQTMSAETASGLLRGQPDTFVELELLPAGELLPRAVKLLRQTHILPSVTVTQMVEEGIGYVQLASFQKTTPQELEEAMLRLRSDGMRVLILDLRGNPGGLFQSGLQVAERFLSSGVIVSTHSQVATATKTYLSQSGPDALAIPLVVLIDCETASTAEVVAGAIKDHQRGTLVGQPTYGKTTVQSVLELKTVPAGLRLSVARFCSLAGTPYGECGIVPHVLVERVHDVMAWDFWEEPQMRTARQEARRLRWAAKGGFRSVDAAR